MVRKLLLAGGDGRMLRLAQLLKRDGYEVQTMGLLPGDGKELTMADALLLPYPFSVQNGRIPALTGRGIEVQQVLQYASEKTLVLAQKGVEPYAPFVRYTQAQGFESRNAEISAEAAVYEAMHRLEKTLTGLPVLVTGYGLFARALAKRLLALGAQTWVAARRKEVRKLAEDDGMKAISLEEMEDVLPKIELVCNTVPAQIMNESALRSLKPDTWLLELASAPYGFDRDLAQALGLRTALLPGLPARYAPQSAAQALHDAVITLFEEAQA